jgi:hypothetical protein
MKNMHDRPAGIYIISLNPAKPPRRLSDDEQDAFLTKYEDTGWEPKLDSLYRECDCTCVELRDIPGLGHLWFDEEGRLTRRPRNPVASAIYENSYRTGEGILGDAVLVLYPDVSDKNVTILEMLGAQHAASVQ